MYSHYPFLDRRPQLMDSDQSFYDILQIPRDATPDQGVHSPTPYCGGVLQLSVRKAYKKQALLTHPDRLPAGFTPDEKESAEDRFRAVSNAYEVLKDPENRRLYDLHGVWPPPTPQEHQQQYSSRHQSRRHRPTHYDPFPDPFANFADPFDLFDRMFSDYRRPSYHRVHRSSSNWHRDPFEAVYRMHDMMADLERDMFSFPSRSFSMGFEPPAFGDRPFGDRGLRWAQQSSTITTRNGITNR